MKSRRQRKCIGTIIAALFVFAALFMLISLIAYTFTQYQDMLKHATLAGEKALRDVLELTYVHANYTFNKATGKLSITITNNAPEPVKVVYIAASNGTHSWFEKVDLTLNPGEAKALALATTLRGGNITVAVATDKGVLPAERTTRPKLVVEVNPVGLYASIDVRAINTYYQLRGKGWVSVIESNVIDTSANDLSVAVTLTLIPNATITVYADKVNVTLTPSQPFERMFKAPNGTITLKPWEAFEACFTYHVDSTSIKQYNGIYVNVSATVPIEVEGVPRNLTLTIRCALYVK